MFDLKVHTNGDFVLIEVPKKKEYISFKYEIYGNRKFFSSGILEIIGDEIPLITFNLERIEDDIFFIKVSAKLETLTQNDTYFSFYNHEETKIKKNLVMEICETNNIIQPTQSKLQLSKLPFNYSDSTEEDGSENTGSDREDEDEEERDSEN